MYSENGSRIFSLRQNQSIETEVSPGNYYLQSTSKDVPYVNIGSKVVNNPFPLYDKQIITLVPGDNLRIKKGFA